MSDYPEHALLPLHEHPRLDVEADFIHVAIAPVADGEAPFAELVGSRSDARAVVSADGGTTRVRLAYAGQHAREEAHGAYRPWWDGKFWDPTWWEGRWKEEHHGKLVLHVPRDAEVRLRSNAGRVHVERLWGCDLSVEAHAGRVTLDDVSGRISLATQAGRIDGHRVGGTLDVSTSAGAVRLDIAFLAAGAHRIRTSMGAVRVALARGMPVRIDATTTLGSARVDFPSAEDAPALLSVEADLGAIRIAASDATWREVVEPPARPASDVPYRTPATASSQDPEVQKILERVANGSLSPGDAHELLRAIGYA